MRLNLLVMSLINRMGMILICSDPLIVAGLVLMAHCFCLQPASELSVM